ncbi:hypothetical protein ASL20_31810 [Cupriavidus necator]|uniref:DUF1484 family protein n=1 Tax=Cupriavidus necator TaxID=106590 RepID=UPI0007357021|nr:DUF1484 family protein [Cupriavidus necator]KUE84783.1 hypothetical protein ASL20_31810 [Cupriavidus necator]
MEEQTASKQQPVLIANPEDCRESLNCISAGLDRVLVLLEVESECSDACFGIRCLVAMIKAKFDRTAGEICPVE